MRFESFQKYTQWKEGPPSPTPGPREWGRDNPVYPDAAQKKLRWDWKEASLKSDVTPFKRYTDLMMRLPSPADPSWFHTKCFFAAF